MFQETASLKLRPTVHIRKPGICSFFGILVRKRFNRWILVRQPEKPACFLSQSGACPQGKNFFRRDKKLDMEVWKYLFIFPGWSRLCLIKKGFFGEMVLNLAVFRKNEHPLPL